MKSHVCFKFQIQHCTTILKYYSKYIYMNCLRKVFTLSNVRYTIATYIITKYNIVLLRAVEEQRVPYLILKYEMYFHCGSKDEYFCIAWVYFPYLFITILPLFIKNQFIIWLIFQQLSVVTMKIVYRPCKESKVK